MQIIENIRTFKTRNFTITVDAVPDDCPVDVDDDGQTAADVDAGRLQLFAVIVRCYCHGSEIAREGLGACIYKRPADFQDHREAAAETRKIQAAGSRAVCGSYFADLIRECIAEARKSLKALQSIRTRPAA